MPIETIGSIKDVLSNYDSKDWAKSAKIDELDKLDFNEMLNDHLKETGNKKSFSDLMTSSVLEVNDLQKEANSAIQKLVTGESKNIHETMLAVEKADIAFRTMNQVRSKVLDAYREVMRMQI